MVSASLESPVWGRRLSSVVPAKATGGNKDFELTNMDLATKLHYIKAVYFFRSEAAQGFSAHDLKGPMFDCLQYYSTASGRIRRSDTDRPFIKCNDGGVRIVEARCDNTVDEWLFMARNNDHSLDHMLACDDHVLGPDLGFSPLVFVQISRLSRKPFSLKKVDPVGDSWLTANNRKMATHSFRITGEQLHYHMTTNSSHDPSRTDNKISDFEIISAIIWQSLSKARLDLGPKVVTVCLNGSLVRDATLPINGMVYSSVEADFCVSKVEIAEIARLIAEKKMPENRLIEYFMTGDEEKSDFIIYGANLTFANLEGLDLYGLELKGLKPVFVNYMINGVGDEGAVLVFPSNEKDGGNGKIVTMTLLEDEIEKLKNILENDWDIAN